MLLPHCKEKTPLRPLRSCKIGENDEKKELGGGPAPARGPLGGVPLAFSGRSCYDTDRRDSLSLRESAAGAGELPRCKAGVPNFCLLDRGQHNRKVRFLGQDVA